MDRVVILLSIFWLQDVIAQLRYNHETTPEYSTTPSIAWLTKAPLIDPPWPGGDAQTLDRFGGPDPEASQCALDWFRYSREKERFETGFFEGVETLVDTIVVKHVRDPSTTILCDGYPRYADPNTVTTITTNTSKYLFAGLPSKTADYTERPPSCTVNPTACVQFYTSMWSAFASFGNQGRTNPILGITASWGIPPEQPRAFEYVPECKTRPKEIPPDVGCGKFCTVIASEAQLLYFPITTVGGVCNGSTITATPTVPGKPNTAVLNGTTYTSGLVYVMFSEVFVKSRGIPSDGNCGPTRTNVLISMRSEELSSVGYRCFNQGYTTYPFNYADLNGVYPPASVYMNDIHGSVGYCISDPTEEQLFLPLPYEQNGFNPKIDIPLYIRQVDPSWSTCGVAYEGALDPPRALTPVSVLMGTTVATLPLATPSPARPGSHAAPPAAIQTLSSSVGVDCGTGGADCRPGHLQGGQASNDNTNVIIIIGSTDMTAVARPDGSVVFGSQTLTRGATATISGVTISIGKDSPFVDGATLPLPTFATDSVPSRTSSMGGSNSRAGSSPSGKGAPQNTEGLAATSRRSGQAVKPLPALGYLFVFALTMGTSALSKLMG